MGIIKNVIRCNHCGDVLESAYTHDFKTCKCGTVSVDGGHDYLRRCFNTLDDFTDLSLFKNTDENGLRIKNKDTIPALKIGRLKKYKCSELDEWVKSDQCK